MNHSSRPNWFRLTDAVAGSLRRVRLAGWIALCVVSDQSPQPLAATPPLTWLWSNPQPNGNNVYDLATSNGLTVCVGDRGRVYTSVNDELWVPRDLTSTKSARAVTFFAGKVVVVGEAGLTAWADAVMLRDSAVTPLDVNHLPTANWLEAVAAGTSSALAVGDNGSVYSTTDGTTWTLQPQPLSIWLRGVAFGNGTFVAVGEGGYLATSVNGGSWQQRATGTTMNLNRVAWLGDRFIAVGDSGKILASSTGSNWNAITGSGATKDLFSVAGTGSMYVVGGDQELRMRRSSGWYNQLLSTSAFIPAPTWTYYAATYDGASFLVGGPTGMIVGGFYTNSIGTVWTPVAESLRLWLWDVARIPHSGYVAVGDFGTVLSSDYGTRWSLELTPTVATNAVLLGVAARADRVVAVGTQGTILASTNGVIWSAVWPKPTTADLQGVTVWGTQFVATGGGGTVLTSPDGYNWTARPTAGTKFLSGVAAYAGRLVAVGDSGTLLTSTDAATWTRVALGTTNWLYRVRQLNDTLVVVGEGGGMFTSSDAIAWTAHASGTTNWLNDVTWFNGRYYVIGTQGTVRSSSDLATWEPEACVTQKALYGAVAADKEFLVVGIEGIILRAQTGELVISPYEHAFTTNQFRLTTKPGRRMRLDQASDLVNFSELAVVQSLDNSGEVIHQSVTDPAPAVECYRARILP